jgi:hypothetical protein
MSVGSISANRWDRRRIKRKAHLFSLLTVLAAAALLIILLVSDGSFLAWIWILVAGIGALATLAGVFWIFERPTETWMTSCERRDRPSDLE